MFAKAMKSHPEFIGEATRPKKESPAPSRRVPCLNVESAVSAGLRLDGFVM